MTSIQSPEGHAGELEYGDHYLFRYDPQKMTLTPVVIDIWAPNGLAFSPDESLLYVADSSLNPPQEIEGPFATSHGCAIRVYDIIDGRLAKDGRLFAEIQSGAPDGIRVDEFGNLWASAEDGIHVFDPAGNEIRDLAVPQRVTNLCFGGDDGRTLFITCPNYLYRVQTTVRDAASLVRSD